MMRRLLLALCLVLASAAAHADNLRTEPLLGTVRPPNLTQIPTGPLGSVLFLGGSGPTALAPGTAGYALTTNGVNANPTWSLIPGTGTVSSVAQTVPPELTISGSPVTVTGTLAIGKANETANTVWAGPTSGGATAPTFRALVGADLPAPSASTLGGIKSFAAVSHQWINQISTSGVPSATQPAFSDISGAITSAQLPAAIASIGADNLIGNPTGGSAAPQAVALTNCTGAQQGLTYDTTAHAFGCNTISGSGTVNTGTAGNLTWYSFSTNVVSGNANANINNGTLTLGFANTTLGSLILEGSSSGAATLTPQAVAGTPTLTIGTASGTIAAAATAPLAIASGTGTVSITGVAGSVLAGSGPAFTATPTLGVAGSLLGTLALAGNTSGTVTITPQATAGTPTLTLPNNSGTFAVTASSPLALSSTTGNLTITGAAGKVLAGAGPAFTATPTLGVAASTTGAVNFVGTTNGTVTLSVADVAGTWTFKLPTGAGTAGQFLQTDGSGNASWTNPAGSGTVNSGTSGRLAYYASTGAAVSGNANANISAGALTLGQASTTLGTLTLEGSSSGAALITPQATAGTPTLTIGTSTGTIVTTAASPLSINATTGQVSLGTVGLSLGGLGGSQSAATANQIPVFPGGAGAAVPTSAATWLTNVGALVDASSLFFASGQPWCDVVAKGAVGDSVTSDVAAFNACFTELSGGSFAGGTVYVPPTAGNTYCLPGGITIPAFLQVVMTSWETSLIACGNNAAPVVTLSSRSAIRNGTIQGYGLRASDTGSSAAQPALYLPSSATGAVVDSMQVLGGTGVNWACGECYVRFGNFSESYGAAQIYSTGGGNLERTSLDGSGAVLSYPYTLNAWTNAGCTPGNLATVSAGAWVLKCHTAGTAGVSNPPVPNWAVTVVDGPHYTTNGTTASGNNVLHFASTTGISDGQFIYDISNPGSIPSSTGSETTVLSHTSTTVTMTANAVANIASSETIAIGGQTWILFGPATYHALVLDAGTSQFLVHDSDLSGPYSSSLEMLNSSPQYTTDGTTSAGNAVLHFASTTGISNGQHVYDASNPGSIGNGTTVSSLTSTTVTMTANAIANIGSSENIIIGNPSPQQFICIECVFTPTFLYGLELRAGGNVYISGGSQIAGGGLSGGVGVLTTGIYFGPTQITNSNITGPNQYGIDHSGPSSGFYVTNTVVGSTSGGYAAYLDAQSSGFQMRGGKLYGAGGGVALISGSDYNEVTGVDFSGIGGTLISLGSPISSHNLITNNVAVPPTMVPGAGLGSGSSHTTGPSPEMHSFKGTDISNVTVNGEQVCFAACQWLMPPNSTWSVTFSTAANDYSQIMQ